MMFDAAERRFRVGKLKGKKAINVTCGSGIANAAAVTQDMLDHFDIMDIVHFGIASNTHKLSSSSSSWRNPNAKLNSNYAANLDVNNYNVPKGHGSNHLGHIGYNSEQLFPSQGSLMMLSPCCGSQSMSNGWLKLAANLRDIFVENAAYANFLFQNFKVSSTDMESAAVVIVWGIYFDETNRDEQIPGSRVYFGEDQL
ncbi:PNP UDP 1 domain-containing protein [Citrus sinensis]|uniref:PNP UDP 1 domain-containing protein n=1 Tax=Citrus sinensis TaxID=2711 RepID=A0ACB8L5S7_CITSI|nr:PNP UDP 1 domain-containing protein [Citrus sinensis]